MASAKTINLLAVAHTYERQHKNVVVFKPALENRDGAQVIQSRSQLKRDADYLLEPDTVISYDWYKDAQCVLIDEAQFLSTSVIEQFRRITDRVPVIAYGLRTDYKSFLFEGSKRLLELADVIEEVKSVCHFCERKSIFNYKVGTTRSGCENAESIEIGGDDMYQGLCYKCYQERFQF